MVWADGGLQHVDGSGNLVFASHLNTKAMQERGNKVISGCIVTEQSPTPDLTVEVASGNVIANGIVVVVSAVDPFAGTPATFATTQGLLTSGQAEFVAVHVDSSGVITNSEGGAAAAGQQTPPEVPEDEVLLAMITLSEGDPSIDTTTDIEDWRQFVPDGQYIAGDGEITGNFDISGHDLSAIGLKLAGTLITASATELNLLDGVTAFSGTPSDIGTSNAAGSSTVIPRLDHVHNHPSGLGTSLHHTKYTDAEAVDAVEAVGLSTPISTDTVVFSDAGVLKRIAFSGITETMLTAFKSYVDGLDHHTKYALTEDLTSGEITQLQNINTETISNAEWAILADITARLGRKQNTGMFGHIVITGAASKATGNVNYSYIQFPTLDTTAQATFSLILPESVTTTPTLRILYSIDGTSGRSVEWTVTVLKPNNSVTFGNVLSASTAYDFPAGTSGVIYIRDITLSDADIVVNGLMGVKVKSDASIDDNLFIYAIWLEW